MSESTWMSGDSDVVNHEASKLCWKWSQAAVLVFEESSHGEHARFVFDDIDRRLAEREMFGLGVEGGLLTGSSLTVFVQRRAEHSAVRKLAALLFANPRRSLGSLRLMVPRTGGKPAERGSPRRRAVVPRRPEPWFREVEPRPGQSEIICSPVAPSTCPTDKEIACRYCNEGRVPRPLTDHFDQETDRAWHTPWFGYLLPCPACREAGRGPRVLSGDEDGGWRNPEHPNLTLKPARPGHATVIFVGKSELEAMRSLGRRLAEQRKKPERPGS